jgi:hypothetical protein
MKYDWVLRKQFGHGGSLYCFLLSKYMFFCLNEGRIGGIDFLDGVLLIAE